MAILSPPYKVCIWLEWDLDWCKMLKSWHRLGEKSQAALAALAIAAWFLGLKPTKSQRFSCQVLRI